jgi:hypothetical protein
MPCPLIPCISMHTGTFEFIGCISASSTCNTSVTACGKDSSTSQRAWFPSSCIPNGWSIAPLDSSCGSCCIPEAQPLSGPSGGSCGSGCTYVNGGICAVLEFRGTAVSNDSDITTWATQLIDDLTVAIAVGVNASTDEITSSLLITTPPTVNNGTLDTYSCRFQMWPPADEYQWNCNDMMNAIYVRIGTSISGSVGSQLISIAAYRTCNASTPIVPHCHCLPRYCD